MVVQYQDGPETRVLNIYYRDKEISFDEPELFAFGETLAKQTCFRAGDATGWGYGYGWDQVLPLLEQLLDAGILERSNRPASARNIAQNRSCPSPLAPAESRRPRNWDECAAITRELTGRSVELGHLELIVPIFRVAHIALDADDRQVGEASVFPRALRLERPTEWLTCIYPGTRYQVDRPMNATALRSMRAHWPQMMAILLRIRSGFLRRFPQARHGWTVGDIERLATLVLSVPTYQLMKADGRIENGRLHPALSSLFRVTDGLRLTMHQMLFVPIGEPALAPDAPMTSEAIHDYAERNYSFHSETGVCAGPRIMVQEFLRVLVDGIDERNYAATAFDPDVEQALADIDAAFDYGLLGLQAYAVVFSLWPAMTRTYERLAELFAQAVQDGAAGFADIRDRFHAHLATVRERTFLASEKWRLDREQVYADMYEQCGRARSQTVETAKLSDALAPICSDDHAEARSTLARLVAARFGSDPQDRHVDAIADILMTFFIREQSVLRAASKVQSQINRLLGRAQASRAFGSDEIDVHNLLQGAESRRLPYLLDELREAAGIEVRIEPDRIALSESRT